METSSAQAAGLDVDESESSLVHGPVEPASPHRALFLALPYLRFIDLLKVRMICKSLRDVVHGDDLLWRHVVLDLEPHLNWKVTDFNLLKLVSKANGRLESLVLIDCRFITDSALYLIAPTNPHITKV
eukprot:TRINITY_DN13102_c1_g1_i3.p1 TRINITY_DN13102_c1_g1~~TRINITY_DN13102_c1_g1_i3.p1  ORF type:complete len:146 (+),score=25.75 TRINITY_DN13102_c1_g1_i3:57-440(+)